MSVQTERHGEAMRLWRMLDGMNDSERAERLADGESEVYSAPCTATLGVLVFRRLGVHDEDREVYWKKLHKRSVGNVWNFYQYMKERPPEEFALRITQFAKKYPPLGGGG